MAPATHSGTMANIEGPAAHSSTTVPVTSGSQLCGALGGGEEALRSHDTRSASSPTCSAAPHIRPHVGRSRADERVEQDTRGWLARSCP